MRMLTRFVLALAVLAMCGLTGKFAFANYPDPDFTPPKRPTAVLPYHAKQPWSSTGWKITTTQKTIVVPTGVTMIVFSAQGTGSNFVGVSPIDGAVDKGSGQVFNGLKDAVIVYERAVGATGNTLYLDETIDGGGVPVFVLYYKQPTS